MAVVHRSVAPVLRRCCSIVLVGGIAFLWAGAFDQGVAHPRHHKVRHVRAAKERSLERAAAARPSQGAPVAFGIGSLSGFFTQGIGGATTAAPYLQSPSPFEGVDVEYFDPRYRFPGE